MSEKYYQVDKEKPEGTPVYPLIRSCASLIKGLLASYVEGRNPQWCSGTPGDAEWVKLVHACARITTLGGDDFRKYQELYDSVNNSVTTIVDQGDTVSSIPAYDSKAVGYRPIELWEKVMYYDGTTWVPRWLSDHRRRGDTIELSVGDDEQSETAWVPMTHVARITPVVPKKALGDTASLLVEAVWEN